MRTEDNDNNNNNLHHSHYNNSWVARYVISSMLDDDNKALLLDHPTCGCFIVIYTSRDFDSCGCNPRIVTKNTLAEFCCMFC